MSGSLMRYDAARRALAEAHRVDEAKSIRDKAVAMQAYAKQAKDTELITKATEIRMHAERRAGEMLHEMKERGERAKPGDKESGRGKKPLSKLTLADLGINKTQSSRWQALAALDDSHFEHKVETASKRAYDNMTRRILKADKIERAQERHRNTMQHGCTVTDLVAIAESGKRFSVIYADPPWPWETSWGGTSGRIASCADHYYGLASIADKRAAGRRTRGRRLRAVAVVHRATHHHRHTRRDHPGLGVQAVNYCVRLGQDEAKRRRRA